MYTPLVLRYFPDTPLPSPFHFYAGFTAGIAAGIATGVGAGISIPRGLPHVIKRNLRKRHAGPHMAALSIARHDASVDTRLRDTFKRLVQSGRPVQAGAGVFPRPTGCLQLFAGKLAILADVLILQQAREFAQLRQKPNSWSGAVLEQCLLGARVKAHVRHEQRHASRQFLGQQLE